MNLDILNEEFSTKSEVEVVRLLTCNFDLSAFSLVEPLLPVKISSLLRIAVKFRTHLSVETTTLDDFSNKIKVLVDSLSQEFKGTATKLCGYSGELLAQSKTLLGTPEQLVSFNEFGYVMKAYPWWIRPVNPTFAPYVDQYVDKVVFLCLRTFDITSLSNKEDVSLVTDKHIVLKSKTKIPIVVVD